MRTQHRCDLCNTVIPETSIQEVEGPAPFAEGSDLDDDWIADSIGLNGIFRTYTCPSCNRIDMTAEIDLKSYLELTDDSLARAVFNYQQTPRSEKRSNVSRWAQYERRPPGLIVRPSPQFSRIVGDHDQPRSEAVAKFWTYVSDHKLRDANDPSVINADRRLRSIFEKGMACMEEIPSIFDMHLDPIPDQNGFDGWKTANSLRMPSKK